LIHPGGMHFMLELSKQIRAMFNKGRYTEAFGMCVQSITQYPQKSTQILSDVQDLLPRKNRYLSYQSYFHNFNIKPSDKVLDIGSGSAPFELATHLADIIVDGSAKEFGRFDSFTPVKGKYVTKCNIENMPFKEKEFDFVYCSHVLEHVINPVKACKELIRVGKRGYVETPTRMKDLMLNTIRVSNHRWSVENAKGNLIFSKYTKEEIENSFPDIMREIICSPKTDRERAISALVYLKANVFNTMLLWEDSFGYAIQK